MDCCGNGSARSKPAVGRETETWVGEHHWICLNQMMMTVVMMMTFGVIVSQILFSRLKNPFSPHRWVGGGKVGEGKMTFRLPTSSS